MSCKKIFFLLLKYRSRGKREAEKEKESSNEYKQR